MDKPNERARRNSDRTMLAAWNLDSGAFTQPGHSLVDEAVSPLRHPSLAWAADWNQYALERSIGRAAADIYLIDVATGARTKVHERLIEDRELEASPNGRYLLYLQDDQYWTVNTATHAVVNITTKIKTSFVDRESDFTTQITPSFGIAGWTKDDAAVILYDKFDLWKVAPDSGQAVRITDGAEHKIRLRAHRPRRRARYSPRVCR